MRPPLVYTLIFILIYSCSKPESFNDLPAQQYALSPGLNVESSYLKDQLISFNMIDSEGNNITSSTSFIVDNQLIKLLLKTIQEPGVVIAHLLHMQFMS